MLLANTIKGYGMKCSKELEHNITTLIVEENITKVVETGSYLGLGTTKAVLKGMKLLDLEYEFISIEVNPEYHKQAVNNNIGSSATFLNGLSIPRHLEPIDISFDGVPDNIIVDHLSHNYEKYRSEIKYNVPDDMLAVACRINPELIILDSAGHIGYIELQYVLGLMNGKSYWLILDDIGHVKHYYSMQYIKERPDEFDVVWESSDDELHRSAIIKVK
jgi:hypothetical protein